MVLGDDHPNNGCNGAPEGMDVISSKMESQTIGEGVKCESMEQEGGGGGRSPPPKPGGGQDKQVTEDRRPRQTEDKGKTIISSPNQHRQNDQGYGSMESSSNGQSHRSSSYSGGGSLTKSRNSGSSQSSGFCDQQNKKGAQTAGLTAADRENLARTGQTEPITNDHAIGHNTDSSHSETTCQDGSSINDGQSEAAINNASIQREKRTKDQKQRDFKRMKLDDGHYQSYDGFQLSPDMFSFAPEGTCSRPAEKLSQCKETFSMPPRSLHKQISEFREPVQCLPTSGANSFDPKSDEQNGHPNIICGQQMTQSKKFPVFYSVANQIPTSAASQDFINQNTTDVAIPPTSSYRVKYEQQTIDDQPTLIYTQALNYIRRIKEGFNDTGLLLNSPDVVHLPNNQHDAIAGFIKSFGGNQRGITMVLSIRDGTVVRVSTNITEVLGFPEELVVGQSFIDFVYPRDSVHFSSKIINGMSLSMKTPSRGDKSLSPFYCRVRQYKSYQTPAYNVRDVNSYKPCKITLKFNNTQSLVEEKELMTSCRPLRQPTPDVLLAEVIPVPSFYKVPDEVINEGQFVIRHSAACNFSEYDPDAIPFLGHLPQDLTGNSIFDCYHPEDLPLLLTIYREIIREEGKPFRSEAYRFRTFNGSWVVLETEWLCFVNPWTRKIDSIIGQHKVIKGPRDISIYMEQCDGLLNSFSEEVCVVARKARRDIIELLSQPVAASLAKVLQHEVRHPAVSPMQQENNMMKVPLAKQRRTLAEMMSCLVNDIHNREMKNIAAAAASKISPVPVTAVSASTSAQTTTSSAMANNAFVAQRCQAPNPAEQPSTSLAAPQATKGESLLSSSESPSTYSRLNYSATMLRFFQSNPRTASTDASAESKMESSAQGSIDEAKSSTSPKQQYCKFSNSAPSGVNKSHYMSGYGSGSGDTIYLTRKYGSKDVTDSGSGESASGPSSASGGAGSGTYRHVPLTEQVLTRHNQEMQMLFMDRQRKNAIAATTASKQRERVPYEIQQLNKSTRKLPSKCAMKRPCSPTNQAECRPSKYPFLERSPMQGSSDPAHHNAAFQMNNMTKPSINSFHSGSSSQAAPLPPANDPNLPTSHAQCRRMLPQPYLVPAHQIPSHANAYQNTNLGTNSSGHISQEQHQLNPSHHNQYPIPPMMMGPHQTPYMTPQGLALPMQYMSGYPGMYIPPPAPFNQAMYAPAPMMMPNMMLPHPFMQQHPPRADQVHVSSSALNPNGRLVDCPEYDIVEVPQIERPVQQQHQQRQSEQQQQQHHHQQQQQQQQQMHPKASHASVHLRKRSDSRATSVKVEPGSVRGSVASASGQLRCSMSHPPESLRSEVDDTAPTDQALLYVPRVPSQASHFSRSTSVLGEAESIASPDKRQMGMDEHQGESNSDMVMSISSPAEDSLQLLSESSVDTNESLHPPQEDRPVLSDPSWLDHVDVTPQLLYRYQLDTQQLVDVLKNDMDALKHLNQPALVEDQLSSLYQELEIDGDHLHLDEGITSSSAGEDMLESSTKASSDHRGGLGFRRLHSATYFSKQAMIHEVEAAIPPSEASSADILHFRRQKMFQQHSLE